MIGPIRRTSKAPYRLYNIGNQQPVELMRYIEVLEDCLGKKSEKNLLPLQQATCRIHGQTSTTLRAMSGIDQARRSKRAFGVSSIGISNTTT